MSNKKLKLSEIKIQSFITSLPENENHQKGQGTSMDTWCTGGGPPGTGGGASVTSECCNDPSETSQTCAAVFCATDASWSTCNGSCPTDFGMDTCAAPGQTGC